MTAAQRLFLGGLIAAAAMHCGCADSDQQSIDNAYRQGRISATQWAQQTRELGDERRAEAVTSMAQNQQQPTGNKNYRKVVNEQPLETNGYLRAAE